MPPAPPARSEGCRVSGNPAVYGHLGLMFGLLGIIVMLGFVDYSVDPYSYGMSAVLLPVILWVVGVVILVAGPHRIPDAPKA